MRCGRRPDHLSCYAVENDATMGEWENRLAALDAELDEREQAARSAHWSPELLAALAEERDKLSGEWDRLAAAYDERAHGRDISALGRDVTASGRDIRAREAHQNGDAGFADRFLSAGDRDSAAGDRADAFDDRARSARARQRSAAQRDRSARDRDEATAEAHRIAKESAAEIDGLREALKSRNVIGIAQGLLMARHRINPDEAFDMLVHLSQTAHVKLREVAHRLVEAEQATWT